MNEKPDRLVTKRLVMEPLKEGDKESFLRMVCDDRVKKTYMLPDFSDSDQADLFFSRLKGLSESKEHFIFGIYRDRNLIGFLNDCELDGTAAELGYFISPECWNRGYATEALQAAIEELFNMGYTTIRAGYFEGNEASHRVMIKCGMHPLAEESTISYRGMNRRCLFCGLSKTEKN